MLRWFVRLPLSLVLLSLVDLSAAAAGTPPTVVPPSCRDGIIADVHTAVVFSRERPAPREVYSSVNIDLLVAYTPAVVARVGSEAATLDEIKSIVAFANQTHENSGTGIHFSLVFIYPLTTDADGTFLTDLNAAASADGVWDELLTLRDDYHADMVSVVVPGTQGGTLCGLAYTNGLAGNFASSIPYMYSVVSVAPACSPVTLAHELGHNLGSQHDEASAASSGWQSYSFGYAFTGASRQRWHTVMAITADREIPFFSSPGITFDGVAIGDSEDADNARSIALAAPEVAAYYASLEGEDLSVTAPPEPDQVTLSVKKVSRGTRLRITARVTTAGSPSAYRSAALYWSRGKRGTQTLGAIGRTSARGEISSKITSRLLPNIYYQGCLFGSAATPVCSSRVNVVRAAR